ncbi:mCpol domain-containing protein [Micromonospora sp. NPDC000207]|uniref:mCpol domain-containing protein n=1 Tax=Micromonospora sp. NPDC000207 TaxID=3154246 RepID=UPI003329E6E8
MRIKVRDRESLGQELWYVGIDGDKTGEFIGEALADTTDSAPEIRSRSNKISQAIEKIRIAVKSNHKEGSILFACGDNILFRGQVSYDFVESLLSIYRQETGLSASAGIGRTPYQASVALSLAKGEGGGAIKAISLTE